MNRKFCDHVEFVEVDTDDPYDGVDSITIICSICGPLKYDFHSEKSEIVKID